MYLLQGNIHPYDWGSKTLLAEVMGRPSPAEQPEAEAWFGAHPGGPSAIVGGDELPAGMSDLAQLVAADPERELGPKFTELPFLVKILAADQALSIQAHPSISEAQSGFAREDEAGIGLDDPKRNYKDRNHKPELLIALSEFRALAGFRPVAETVRVLDQLDVPALRDATAQLRAAIGDTAAEKRALRAVLQDWLNLPETAADEAIIELVERCREIVGAADAVSSAGSAATGDQLSMAAGTVVQLSEDYPHDPGILVCLLLNRVTLRPGEAIFLAAGQLHAYLSGLGVEVMANSNNVLRGGLTPKHIDVPELLHILDATPLDDPRCRRDGNRYLTSAEDFAMAVVRPGETSTVAGPAVVLAAGGELTVHCGGRTMMVPSGYACWVSYADGKATVTASGAANYGPTTGFIATVGSTG